MAVWQCIKISYFLIVLMYVVRCKSQPCQAGNISCLVVEQSSLLGVAQIQETIQTISVNSDLRGSASINGTAIVVELAGQLAANLQEVAMEVRNLTSEAGREYSAHVGRGCCSLVCLPEDEVTFNRTACSEQCPGARLPSNESDSNMLNFYRATVPNSVGSDQGEVFRTLDLQLDEAVGRSVDLNNSAIHYPLDIYDRDLRVLCFAQWSDNLTQYFVDHRISPVTASVQFQYFGAASGASRFYPGHAWSFLNKCHRCPLEQVDTYDTRFRPWFSRTVSGFKVLIIVLDLSGSMTGFRLLLAKLTAKQLLLSLSHNDYFHVLTVGWTDESSTALRKCFSTPRRASPENILTIVEVIDNISESRDSTGTYMDVVLEAQESFNNPAVPETCYKVLVFLTDRDILISDLSTVLRTSGREIINKASVMIVMMGYPRIILREDIQSLRDITSQTGGFIQEIESYSTINMFLLRFLETLRRLFQVEVDGDNSDSEVFWNHYRDISGGIVLTCSQPLYVDIDPSNQTNSTFIGVGGIDVNRTLLALSFQQYDLGPYGYGFLVDNNGQLLVHPLINNSYVMAISGDDLLTLDMSNFEQSDAVEEARAAILNRTTGSIVTNAWVPVGGQRSEFRRMRVTYNYAPIPGTPFSVVIVIPESHSVASPTSSLSAGQLEFLNSTLSSFSQTYSIALLRPICNVSEFSAGFDPVTFLRQLIEQQMSRNLLMPMDDGSDNCSQDSINGVLLDLWTAMNETTVDSLTLPGQHVVEFPSGLFVSDRSVSCQGPPVTLPTRSAVLDFALQMNSSDSIFYTNTTCGFSWFTVLDDDVDSGQPVNPASSAIYGQICPPLPLTSTPDSTLLLVQGQGRGLILNSTNAEEVGQYFGDVYPHVFNDAFSSLSNLSVLRGYEVRPCSNIFRSTTVCLGSSAHSVYQGILLSVMSVVWWVLTGGPLLSLHLLVTSFMATLTSSQSGTQAEKCPVKLCDHQVAAFQWPRPPFSRTGSAICDNTSMTNYSIEAISSTNLFLVEILGIGNCNDTPFLDIDDPSHVIHCPCSIKSDRYRVPPPTVSDDSSCLNRTRRSSSSATNQVPSKYLLYPPLILSIFIAIL